MISTRATDPTTKAAGPVTESSARAVIDAPSERFGIWDWALCGLLILASLAVGLVHVPQHDSISPIDEFVYIDYLAKVPTEGVVQRGEETGDYAREYFACNGVRTYIARQPDLCNASDFDADASFPFNGKTSADLYAPLYFGTTWVVAQPLQWAGISDLTEAGRYTGWMWLAAALVLLYATLRRLNVARFPGFGMGLVVAGSLPAYWSHTYISTDATALPAGALMLFLAVYFLQTRRHGWLLPRAAVLVTLSKLQNLMAVGAVGLLLVLCAAVEAFAHVDLNLPDKIRIWSRSALARVGFLAVFAALLAQVGWTVIRSVIAVGPAPDQLVATPIGWTAMLSEVFKFFPGAIQGAVAPDGLGVYAIVIASLGSSLIAAGVLGLIAVGRPRSFGVLLAISALTVALVAGPALAIANLATSGFYFPLPARYGLALVPIFVCCAALLFSNKRWTGYAVGSAGAVAFLLSLAVTEIPM